MRDEEWGNHFRSEARQLERIAGLLERLVHLAERRLNPPVVPGPATSIIVTPQKQQENQ